MWKTESGKAEFTVPRSLSGTDIADAPGRLRLVTLRSNDQFNTTIYGYDDRFRGISGTRDVVLMNPKEIEKAGLHKGQVVTIVGDSGDGVDRRVAGLKVVPFDLPDGCIAGYYPELNPLIPLQHHDRKSKTPACKAVPVRIEADAGHLAPFVRSPRARELARHDGPLPAGLATLAAPGTTAALWDNGPRWWLVEAASAAQLRSLRPDFAGIAGWSNATASTGVAVFAFEDGADHQLAVRAFCPGDAVNVPEDPVTGSANAAIAACLHRQGRLPGGGNAYVASQGRELGRDGRVAVRVDTEGEVWIGGQVQQVIAGTLDW